MYQNNTERKYKVCDEAPVELIVNGKSLVTFMCTPLHLNELAVGYLYCRGLISSLREIYTLGACDEMRKILVNTAQKLPEDEYSLAQVLTSGCGSGMLFSEDFLEKDPIRSTLQVEMGLLKRLAREMFDQTVLYKETGGVHCAALASRGQIIALREDVGRHNAVDKIVGKGLFLEEDFSQAVILTTGRVSTDMVLKAVASGVSMVVTRSIPTSLAMEMAKKAGLTIVGRVFSKEPIVYTHSYRIIDETDYSTEIA